MRDSRSAPLSGALFASPRLLKVGFGLAADLRVVRSAHGSLRCCCAASAVSPSVDLVNEWRKLRGAGAVSSASPPPRASTSEGGAHGANGAAARRFVRALRDGARGAVGQALLPLQLGQEAASGNPRRARCVCLPGARQRVAFPSRLCRRSSSSTRRSTRWCCRRRTRSSRGDAFAPVARRIGAGLAAIAFALVLPSRWPGQRSQRASGSSASSCGSAELLRQSERGSRSRGGRSGSFESRARCTLIDIRGPYSACRERDLCVACKLKNNWKCKSVYKKDLGRGARAHPHARPHGTPQRTSPQLPPHGAASRPIYPPWRATRRPRPSRRPPVDNLSVESCRFYVCYRAFYSN